MNTCRTDCIYLQVSSHPTITELRSLAQIDKLLSYQRARTIEAEEYAKLLQRHSNLASKLSLEHLATAVAKTRSHATIMSDNEHRLLVVLEEAVLCGADAVEEIRSAATDAAQQAKREQEQLSVLQDATLPAANTGIVEERQARLDAQAQPRVSPPPSAMRQPAATGKKRRRHTTDEEIVYTQSLSDGVQPERLRQPGSCSRNLRSRT